MKIHPLLTAAVLALASAARVQGGLVEDWNEVLTAIFQKEAPPPARAARDLAIVHTAISDAVVLASGGAGQTFWKTEPPLPPTPTKKLNAEARAKAMHLAADAAARTATASLYPGSTGLFPAGPASSEAWAWASTTGTRAAQTVLAARASDGASTTVHYVPKRSPGQWRRTTNNRPPELPQWPHVVPFCLSAAAQFRPPAPPAPDSPEAKAERETVACLGGKDSTVRTPQETETARFWSDFSYTSTPPGHWNAIARDLCIKRKLSLQESAALFARLNLALADAGIACWEAKYFYNCWRPSTALRADGGATAEWTSLLPSPSHPEYVSGHSTFSAAAAVILADAFPAKDLQIEVRSDTLPGVVRHFTSFQACVKEIGHSRILGGIHFPSADAEGQRLGQQVGAAVLKAWEKSSSTVSKH